MIGIYKITNPLNEVYIGQSKDIDLRLYHHKRKSSNKLLKESIEKYGWVNHKIEVLCECTSDELNEKEEYFIKTYLVNNLKIFNSFFTGTNGGRKKLTNERFQVRCHPKVIAQVRNFAKEKSEEYLNKLKNDKL